MIDWHITYWWLFVVSFALMILFKAWSEKLVQVDDVVLSFLLSFSLAGLWIPVVGFIAHFLPTWLQTKIKILRKKDLIRL